MMRSTALYSFFSPSRPLPEGIANYLIWAGLIVLLLAAVLLVLTNKRFDKYWQILADGVMILKPVGLEVKDFESDGLILDIGGGGEGVISRLKGNQVVALDIRQAELEESPPGPLKVVMDARQLGFPDGSFTTATAFFSMMYMKTREDHKAAMSEAWRVLKPGGRLYLWDVDLSVTPQYQERILLGAPALPGKWR